MLVMCKQESSFLNETKSDTATTIVALAPKYTDECIPHFLWTNQDSVTIDALITLTTFFE